jgi:sulfopyruvate decarboxylase subunit alpha
MVTQVVQSVPAEPLHTAIRELGITHVVTVPDTHQRTLLDRLYKDEQITVITVSTEHEAIGINAGLYMGGVVSMVLIQQLGLFAGMNALRGIALDMNVPTLILAGLYGRDVTRTTAENDARSVRLVGPMLDAMGVPHYSIDGPGDVGVIRTAFDQSRAIHGPTVVFVGAPTC